MSSVLGLVVRGGAADATGAVTDDQAFDQHPATRSESGGTPHPPGLESADARKNANGQSSARAAVAAPPSAGRAAARLFLNAAFLTMDRALPRAGALLVRDGAIVAAGEPDDLRRRAPDALVVDLGGRFACPGFVDAHNHLSLTALAPVEVDCRPSAAASIDALLARVRSAVAALPPGRWLRGHGYDDTTLGRHPTRADLDAAAPHNPVVLVHWTVHRCVANSAALASCDIDARSPDPPGGWLVRDVAGVPTGLLYERAGDPVQAASLAAYLSDHRHDLPGLFAAASAHQLREGITAIGDAYVHPTLLQSGLYESAGPPVIVRPFCGSGDGLFAPPWDCTWTDDQAPPSGLLPRGVKIFADGGGNTTAASLASGRPPRFLFYRQDELDALVARAHGAGLPVAVHAAGDIAVTMALDAFARARRAHPHVTPRFRIEHAITLKDADIPRLRDLGVAVVTQPEAVYLAGERLAAAGLAEGVRVAPFRALLDAGVTVAFSSDSPCYALSPLRQVWCAVTRATEPGGVLADGQAVTVEEALTAYTVGGARALFADDRLGALRPGLRADFVIFSADPRATPLDRWPSLRVEQTFLAGVEQDTTSAAGIPPPGRPVLGW